MKSPDAAGPMISEGMDCALRRSLRQGKYKRPNRPELGEWDHPNWTARQEAQHTLNAFNVSSDFVHLERY